MKQIVYRIFSVFFISVLGSCSDSVTDLSIDPDGITEANDSEVLTSAIGYMGAIQDNDLNLGSFLWAQYYTWGIGVSLGNAERFVAEPDDENNYWQRSYANVLADLDYLKTSSVADYRGVACILSAYVYQSLVDHFGNVPYTEALEGSFEDGSNFDPIFDDASAIYSSLIEEIDAGLAELEGSNIENVIAEDDLIYGGDLDQWVKFANSLKLRIYMRTSEVDPKDSEVISLISSASFIETEDDLAELAWSGEPGNENPMYAVQTSGVGDFYFASNATVNLLESLGDPRLAYFYDLATSGDESGTINGIDQGSINLEEFTAEASDYSGSSDYANSAAASTIFMSPWEVWFLRAEADLRFGTADDSETALGTAITLNFDHIGVDGAADYITSLMYSAADDIEKMDIIGIQKWISFNGTQEDEGWIEARRFDRPDSRLFSDGIWQTPTESVLGEGVFPSAWLYPASELSTNPNAESQRTITDAIFWDN